MIQLSFDEDFNGDVVRGTRHRSEGVGLSTVREVVLAGSPDTSVLDYASRNALVVVSHDKKTMTAEVSRRSDAEYYVLGLVIVKQFVSVAVAINDLILIGLAGLPGDIEDKISCLPLK